MKKYIAAAAAVLVLALSGAAWASGGTQADPLISKSYLEGTYYESLRTAVMTGAEQEMKAAYEEALKRLEALAQRHLASLGADVGKTSGAQWETSSQFVEKSGEREDTVTLSVGSGILWTSGAASVSGVLADVTDGAEVTSGGALQTGHRYLAAEETVITVTSRTARWSLEGQWTTTADGISVTELTFKDVPEDAYYFDAVLWAVENKITSGTSATTFSPGKTCTRAQMVTFLWRAAGCPEPENTDNPFADVKQGTYYFDAVLWAVERGITNGTSATTFSPDNTVTRGQAVTFLYRFAGTPAISGSGAFTDVPDSAYYSGAVLWAARQGITNGTSATTFSPGNSCTRAHIVTFLYRLTMKQS